MKVAAPPANTEGGGVRRLLGARKLVSGFPLPMKIR